MDKTGRGGGTATPGRVSAFTLLPGGILMILLALGGGGGEKGILDWDS